MSFSWSEVKQIGMVLFSAMPKYGLCKIITLSQEAVSVFKSAQTTLLFILSQS
jgi:hypothetical protein